MTAASEQNASSPSSPRRAVKKPKAPPAPPQVAIGKRKRAVALARFAPGTGVIRINGAPLERVGDAIAQLKMKEPLLLAGEASKAWDIAVSVHGGGFMGQADAVRQAVSRGLAARLPELKERLLKYDRFMLVYDPRRTEPHKPPRSSQGPRRAKQKSKR